ncbi:glycosyltransferase [bacterium]|nr:glycosyltransferase [bacterium]
MPRADLHVHTSYSDRPTNFFLKKLGAPESLTEPEAAYRLAKRRGMDFLALTDPDTLESYRQVAHHPDVIPGCETTVAFPEDDCKVKLIVLDINEDQLQKMISLRGNIFSVRDYLLAEHLYHVVAHPLEVLNARMGADHVEKLLLLFDHFEVRSGGRHLRTNEFLSDLLESLTPEYMESLYKKWVITPASDKPWQKGMIGASNDYCGQYIGLTYTELPQAKSADEFIAGLRRREGIPGGIHGTTISSAHSMYRVAFQFYRRNLQRGSHHVPDLLSILLSKVLQPGEKQRLSVGQFFIVAFEALKKLLPFGKKSSFVEKKLLRAFIKAYRKIPDEEKLNGIDRDSLQEFDERLYRLADRVVADVTYQLVDDAATGFNHGKIGNALSMGAAILPLQGLLSPYLYSFEKLNRDRTLLLELEGRLSPSLDLPSHRPQQKKIAWFSDTVTDVNGVSMTLHKMADVAVQLAADLEIICSMIPEKAPTAPKFVNFPPVGEIKVPDYETQTLALPPGMQMIRYLEAANFTEYVISTPGPVGLVALYAARLFQVPCRAIYHSDFPQHVRHITGDEGLEETTWRFMRWFYGRADAIYSPSNHYREQLIEHGFDKDKLYIFHRGTDLEKFNPKHRDESYFKPWGGAGKVVYVYTGRVSREKNLDTLIDAFLADDALRTKGALAIFGDGPYLSELRERYSDPAVMFPGFVKDKALARAYASGDVFVFPSTTDTYGNSVLEAQASGLPAIVSNEGGPKEIIAPGKTGIVLPGYDTSAWTKAMHELLVNTDKRQQMASAARAHTATRDWTTAFREFWDEDPYPQLPPHRRMVSTPA